MPKISVIMPVYNTEKYLREAIESILNQTFTNFEFIIIDDCSIDNSWNIIQEYKNKDNRIITLKNENNLKICETLNKGIKVAKGEYIARMDSDDVCLPNRFGEQIKLFEQDKEKEFGVVGTNFFIINDSSETIGQKKFPETDMQCKRSIWFRNPFAHNSVLIRKECFKDNEFYNKEFIFAEDLELWIRLGKKYKFYNIQQNLVKYRIYGENSIFKNQKLMIKNTLKARFKAVKLGYKININTIVFFIGTFIMLFLPSKLVFKIFNKINT